MNSKNLVYLIQVSLFSSISTVLAIIEIPLFFVPNIYKLDLSEAITLISGFYLGPLAAVLTSLLKTILILLIKGSSSLIIGEFANLIIGLSLSLPSAFIYKYKRTFKGACIGMIIGIVLSLLVSSIANYFILIPLYSIIFSIPIQNIIDLGNMINKNIVDKTSFILWAVLPFNFVKSLLSCLLTIILYKKISAFVNKLPQRL